MIQKKSTGKNLHVIIGLPMRAMPKYQEANSFYVKRDKMVDGTPRGLCMSHSPTMGPICGEETGHSKSSGKQIWKLIWNKQKIIAWS